MKGSGYILLLLTLVSILSSCEKEEKPVVLPPKPDEVKMLSVDMGKDYTYQIFLDIHTGQSTVVENKSWDLAFDASAAGVAVFQNSGKDILTVNSGSTTFKTNPNLNAFLWNWTACDAPSGHHDSLAIKHTDSVYYIKIGGVSTPYQFRIKSITSLAYTIEVSDMANTWTKETVVSKDPTKNQVYFSFTDGGQYLNIEPPKTNWHICFLRYRWIYHEFADPLRYLVSGVFINQSFVTVVQDSVLDFYAVTKNDCAAKTFLSRRDVIGYEWKSPDLSNTSNVKYTIRKHYYYFIQEHAPSNRLFKLRFIDFYNDQGVKGTPKFEVQEL